MSATTPRAPFKVPHPAFFALLLYPFGAVSGYLSVAIGFELGANHVSVAAIGILFAISFFPNIGKFLWAPVVDITFTPKLWYFASTLATALGVMAMSLVPPVQSSMPLLTLVVIIATLASTVTSMSAEVIAVQVAPEAEKGRFGGWMQVGNLLGGGIGGGLGLLILQKWAPWMHIGQWLSDRIGGTQGPFLLQHWGDPIVSGGVIGLTSFACCIALFFVPNIVHHVGDQKVLAGVIKVAKETWGMATSRAGSLAILVLFLPMSTGAASGLWSAIAGDWKASADTVALATGAWSGVVAGIGCLIGGYFADKMERKWSYALFGIMQAACAVAMALSPKTEMMFIVFTLLYALTSGLTYASYAAVALEAAGVGAAATSYNVLACLSNVPIQYMTVVDSQADAFLGVDGMLFTEAGICLIAVIAYLQISRRIKARGGVLIPA